MYKRQDEHRPGHHDGQRQKPSEDERGPLPYATLGRQHENEGGEWDRFKRDDQTDQQQVEDHIDTVLPFGPDLGLDAQAS